MKTPLFRFAFFLLVCLLPLTATGHVVPIPDANLRAAIEKALGVTSGIPITADEMATLTRLEASEAGIRDLTGLEHATNLIDLGLWKNSVSDLSSLAGLTNLTGLYLGGSSASDLSPLAGLTNLESLFLDANGISNLSALAGLTKLTRLALSNNSVSNLSPLAALTSLRWMRLAGNNISDLSPLVTNTGLGDGDELEIQGNPLSYTSIKTHIPALKNRGVTVEFDDVTHLNFGEPRTVRLIYFLPSDRSSQRDIDTKLDTLIRNVQQFYADEMERHGFGRKSFTFETDANGKTVVHHVDGKLADSYYRQNTFHKVWEEIREQFYTPQNIYFIAIDIGNERVGRGYNEVCGVGDSHGASGGHVLIPASGDCFNLRTAAHELGHAFGLQHDFRSDTYIMSFGREPDKLSECAAEWLDAHRYFNIGQSQTHFDNPTTIQMLSPFASPPYAIGLRFEVTDPDGVHQAQLLTPATIRKQELWESKLLSCKRLNGETDTIEIEFITSQLTVNSSEVTLSVIDVYGNITSQMYPIDITTILSTETVSRPDKNQVINILEPVPPPFTVRDAFELDPFYQQWIDVEGLPVVSSAKANSYALKEAAWQIWQMIGHRVDVLQALVQKRVRFSVIAHNELITEIPEYSDQGPDFLQYWARGAGGSGKSGHSAVSSSEENLLNYPSGGGSYNVLIHEFAHAIHLYGLNTIDPTFDKRLTRAYDAAMEKGLWKGTYASSDRREYWAEGTQSWFTPEDTPDDNSPTRNHVNTRTELKNYDPGLAALLAEIYGNGGWRYTPPTARTHLPHLQGFDPQDSPTFQGWPELEELYRQFRSPNSDGGGRWVDLRPYDPNLLPSLNKSRTAGGPTGIGFINLTQADVLLYGVRYDGTDEFWTRVPPGYIRAGGTTANEMWLVKDSNGSNLAVFQALEKPGRALINATPIFITPGLSKISGDNQTGVSGTTLANPFVIEVRAENGSVLEGIAVTFTVTTGDGTLRITRTTTDANGRAQSILTLGPNLGTVTVSVSAAGIGQAVTFNAVARAAVEIPDSNLRTAIETALGKASGAPITAAEMATLTELTARDANISNLTGLEHATHLTRLELVGNNIGDVSVLTGLTKLTLLFLDNNRISNLSPLAELTRLTHLGAEGNRISDISVLAGLTSLTWLRLWDNSISNISPLAELTQLTELYLKNNNISDISPLVENTGLGNGDQVLLNGNPLSHSSINTHIPTLQGRGVVVEFDNRTPQTIRKISGDAQEGLPGAPLANQFVVEVQDENRAAFEGVPITFTVSSGGGNLSVTSTTTDKNGRAESILTVGLNPGTNTVTVSVTGIQEEQTLTAEGIRILKTLEIVSGDAQEGLPGAALDNPFVVEVRDLTDKPLPDAQVTFSVTSGSGTLSLTSATTDSSGRAESTLTLGPNLGTNTVSVSVTGIQAEQSFNAEGIRTPTTLEIVSGDDQEGLPGAALDKAFVVEVRNQSDKPLPEVQVTFSVTNGGGTLSATSVTTDANGRAESTLMLGPNPGTNTVTVSVAGITQAETFNAQGVRIPKTLEIVSGDDQEGLPGAALDKAFVVEVRNQSDKPLPEVQVTFSVTNGGGTLSATSVTTDANGRAESRLTLGPNPGTNTVTVSVTGTQEKQTFSAEGIRIPETLEIISGKDQKGLPGTALDNPFVVEVWDQTDKPLPDAQVTFSVSSGEGNLSVTSTTTDKNGRTESRLTLGPNPGTNTVTVSVTGITQTETFNAEGIRIPLAFWIISGDKQQGLPDAALAKPFVVEVRDQSGEPLPGVLVTFSVSSGGGNLSVTSTTTDKNGRAESTLTLGPNPGTNTITVSVTGIQAEQTFTAEGIRIPKTLEIISGKHQEGSPATALENPFVVEVRDQTDKPLPDAQVTFSVASGGGTLSLTSATTDSNGRAESILTLGPNPGTNTVEVGVTGIQEKQSVSAIAELPVIPQDVNRDDVVNILDLVLVASDLGVEGADLAADVNGDEVVNILDLVLVAGAFGNAAAAPSVDPRALAMLTAVDVGQWLAQAQTLDLTDAASREGVLVLEQLLVVLAPKETILLPNYPNPFNPETWIPYQLAENASVTLTIYDMTGVVVRRLDLGHRLAGYYTDRTKAAYWNGRNESGESVASGLYFYQLATPSFRQLRRLVILK